MPLISFDEALAVLRSKITCHGRVTSMPVGESLGLVLAEEVVAAEGNPRFDNSAVDGYAVGSGEGPFKLVGEVMAGEVWNQALERGTCVRIMTGAPVPNGTSGIVMQEEADVAGGLLSCQPVTRGQFVRRTASDFGAGTVLLSPGEKVNPGTLALLASQGIERIQVFEPAWVTILTTGDEIVAPSKRPGDGQLRDSNGAMLRGLAEEAGAEQIWHEHVKDDRSALRAHLLRQGKAVDIVILAGGASVGDRDHVPSVLAEVGEVFFHGVSMRPGKPVLFGKCGRSFVFGLPGNPASSFACFHLFVKEAIRRVMGQSEAAPIWSSMPFSGSHEPCGREDFLRMIVRNGVAEEAFEQGSFGLRSLAKADGLIRLPADRAVSTDENYPVLLF